MTLYLYVDEFHNVTAFTEPNGAAQEYLEYGGGTRIKVTVDANGFKVVNEEGEIEINPEPIAD